jgi:hypothetical protein
MNSKIAEDNFLISILCDLKGYSEHNAEELDYILQLVKHRKDQLEHTVLQNIHPKVA